MGSTANQGTDTFYSLHVVGDDFRTGFNNLSYQFFSSLEIGDQYFYCRLWVEAFDFLNGTCPMCGSEIR